MRRLALLIATLAVITAACAAADATDTTDAPTTTAAITTTTVAVADESAAEAPAADAVVGLVLREFDAGEALATNDGRTVYLFTNDNEDASACTGGCLELWPPVPAAADLGYGLDARLVGSIERADGSIQATYDGAPLYFFAGDEAPGDANGQGYAGVWFLVGPDGSAVGEPRGGYGY